MSPDLKWHGQNLYHLKAQKLYLDFWCLVLRIVFVVVILEYGQC